jgi:nucleoside-diphosphate-sugar epimerase
MKRILVTGAAGQVGTELVPALRAIYGASAVLASDVRSPAPEFLGDGPFVILDCLDAAALARIASEHHTDIIFHLAAVLSVTAEEKPQLAYTVNQGTLFNVLEVAREHGCAVFTPSSIAAFGPSAPRDPTPQDTLQRPITMYGVTKVAGELLCDYYHRRWNVDTRGLRYPGLISYVAPPGGGTTDYAIHIFYHALRTGRYTCFLAPDTQIDMMFMPDAVRAALELMETDGARLRHRNAFNVTAMQLTPDRLASEIRRHLPAFQIEYAVDPVRQSIADSWPRHIDDSAAREEWGWEPRFGIEETTRVMLARLAETLGVTAGSRATG